MAEAQAEAAKDVFFDKMPAMRTAIATLFLFAVSAAQAKAELTVKEYKERMASSDAAVIATTRAFINGLGVGIGWANTDSKVKLFCQPGKTSS